VYFGSSAAWREAGETCSVKNALQQNEEDLE